MGAQIQTTILAFDDDASFLRQLKESLSAEYSVETATSIPQAMKTVMTRHLDLILLDMNMPEMSGLEFLKTLRQRNHNTPVIMLTGETKTETVVATIQAGAVDYVVKGTEDFIVNLSFRISQALKIKSLIKDNAVLSRKVASDSARFEIVGISTSVTKLRSEFLKFKNSHSTVLITGENGTGKELIARNLNLQEKNPARPFIAVNCGAIPENLFESELTWPA
jgi:DNA-binding NtrC family response regulator